MAFYKAFSGSAPSGFIPSWLKAICHVKRQISNATFFSEVIGANDILGTEFSTASFYQRVQRCMPPTRRTLHLYRTHLDASPNHEIYLHSWDCPRMEQKIVPPGDKRLRNIILKKHSLEMRIVAPPYLSRYYYSCRCDFVTKSKLFHLHLGIVVGNSCSPRKDRENSTLPPSPRLWRASQLPLQLQLPLELELKTPPAALPHPARRVTKLRKVVILLRFHAFDESGQDSRCRTPKRIRASLSLQPTTDRSKEASRCQRNQDCVSRHDVHTCE